MSKLYKPNRKLFKNAHIKDSNEYLKMVEKSKKDYLNYWGDLAKKYLDWDTNFTEILDDKNAPYYKWFSDGKINIAKQCIDRHLDKRGDKVAIIFDNEQKNSKKITYNELNIEVNRCSNLLCNEFNIKKGDRVIIYMSMIPEAIYFMLACAKIGAIHSVVFAGFSSKALRDRIDDTDAKLIIINDGTCRKNKIINIKSVVDDALKIPKSNIKVLIVQNINIDINIVNSRDYIYNDLIIEQKNDFIAQPQNSEDTLFILYTSGSTGKPKGIVHSSAGYILWAMLTTKWVFNIEEESIFWCTADIGWITGHTYSVYGPLALGSTIMLYEGVPIYPNYDRVWEIIDKYKITQFYTAPTFIRMLHKNGINDPQKHDLNSLKVLGTVGEPINETAWQWYYEKVGNKRCSIVDTWWQTETGGHMISPLPVATDIKPSSATLPLPGIETDILDQNGNSVRSGMLCITKPWPSMARTVWNDNQRFIDTYFSSIKSNSNKYIYFSGDGAYLDEHNYYNITGRIDDVINQSGHRFGTAELESSIAKTKNVAEVAIVGFPDELKGEGILAYIITNTANIDKELLTRDIKLQLKKDVGNVISLDRVVVTKALPKTRSGKIVRRLLKTIAKGEEITEDISTLENQNIIKELISDTQGSI